MTRRRPARILTGALLACLLLTGCSSLDGTGDKGFVSGDGRVQVIDAAERDGAVALTGEDLDGEPLDLADLRGKPAVVLVWGSWCAPCRAEAPELVAADRELRGEAEFVGINVRDASTAQAKGFVRTFGVDYPSFYSPDGKALLSFSGTLSPNSIPATVVLDAEGRVAASILGSIPSTRTLVDVVHDVADGAEAARGATDG
jgi:thiol-disulfide isomerase/thioredoxin